MAGSDSYSADHEPDSITSWLQSVLGLTSFVNDRDDPLPQVEDVKSSAKVSTSDLDQGQGMSFPKLGALKKTMEKCWHSGNDATKDCRDLLILEHSMDHLRGGQYKAMLFVACMKSLKKQEQPKGTKDKHKATVAVTQWENRAPRNSTTRLFDILRNKLLSCASHCAMLRLNGFEIEDVEPHGTFRTYLSPCKASAAWKESTCTSIPM